MRVSLFVHIHRGTRALGDPWLSASFASSFASKLQAGAPALKRGCLRWTRRWADARQSFRILKSKKNMGEKVELIIKSRFFRK